MLRKLRERRREKVRSGPFPAEWIEFLETNVSLYRRLPESDRRELCGHVLVFLDEKQFEGCDGFIVTDEVRVTIAGGACILLLRRDTDYFPHMKSIFVYPSEFFVDVEAHYEDGTVDEFTEDRSGESWHRGPVVLSWKDVVLPPDQRRQDYNVVLHEFAHQLDLENGAVDGVPKLATKDAYKRWRAVFTPALEALRRSAEGHGRPALDPYGAQGPSEFFAVAVEAFFQRPRGLRMHMPRVYELLTEYFHQDPAEWWTGRNS